MMRSGLRVVLVLGLLGFCGLTSGRPAIGQGNGSLQYDLRNEGESS
jgi:hypothetical protein